MSMIETTAANENIKIDDSDSDDIFQLLQQEGQVSEREQQQEGDHHDEKKDREKRVDP